MNGYILSKNFKKIVYVGNVVKIIRLPDLAYTVGIIIWRSFGTDYDENRVRFYCRIISKNIPSDWRSSAWGRYGSDRKWPGFFYDSETCGRYIVTELNELDKDIDVKHKLINTSNVKRIYEAEVLKNGRVSMTSDSQSTTFSHYEVITVSESDRTKPVTIVMIGGEDDDDRVADFCEGTSRESLELAYNLALINKLKRKIDKADHKLSLERFSNEGSFRSR